MLKQRGIYMNNKGQTLIVFLIVIPISFLILGLLFNQSILLKEKRIISNNLKTAIKYRFTIEEDIIDEKIYNYLEKNIENIESLNVLIEEGSVRIYLSCYIDKGILSIIKSEFSLVSFNYYGYLDNGEIKIKKE